MSEIVPFGAFNGAARDQRQASRSLERTRMQNELSLERARLRNELSLSDVDNAVDLSMTKTDAVTTATGAGMTAIARVAQAQTQLELMSPQASARLNMLADAHSMVVLDQLVDLSRKVRRL